jgi:hypothetical protein
MAERADVKVCVLEGCEKKKRRVREEETNNHNLHRR